MAWHLSQGFIPALKPRHAAGDSDKKKDTGFYNLEKEQEQWSEDRKGRIGPQRIRRFQEVQHSREDLKFGAALTNQYW